MTKQPAANSAAETASATVFALTPIGRNLDRKAASVNVCNGSEADAPLMAALRRMPTLEGDRTALLYCVTTACYIPPFGAAEEMDVGHGIVDVFAFQEALLMEAIFGIALLTMIWVGFRRWLQYKEKIGQLIAEQTAERAAQYGAQMERVEARLKAMERIVTEAGVETAGQIDALPTNQLPDPT